MMAATLLLGVLVRSALASALTTGDNIFRPNLTCHELLRDADVDQDGQINRTEYVGLVNLYTVGYFDKVKSFDMLPLSLQANFVTVACLCGMLGYDIDCCTGDDAHLVVPNVIDDKDVDFKQNNNEWYFDEVCSDTFETIAALITVGPTSQPTSRNSSAVPIANSAANVTATPATSPSPSAVSITNSTGTTDLQRSRVEESPHQNQETATGSPNKLPWRKKNRGYFIPIVLISCFIVVASGFSLSVVIRRKYQYRLRKDPQGFILGSFPQLQTASTLTTDWCANGFVASSLDDQDCAISYEYSGYESDTGSRVSLRSINVPLWFTRPYSHYRYAAYRDDTSRVSPMSSEQGSEQGSIQGSNSPLPVRHFGGDHITM